MKSEKSGSPKDIFSKSPFYGNTSEKLRIGQNILGASLLFGAIFDLSTSFEKVASITEFGHRVEAEKCRKSILPVNQDIATRRAGRLGVQFDVG
jgi:hypothetical protein